VRLESTDRPLVHDAVPQSRDRPLTGRRIAVTWSVDLGQRLSSQLEAARARVTPLFASAIVPVRDTTTLDTALRNARRYDGIVLTSLAAVESVARRLAALALGRDACRHISIALLGPANVRADETMARLGGLAGKRLLLPRAERTRATERDSLAEALRRRGAEVEEVDAYRAIAHPVDASSLRAMLARNRIDAIVCTDSAMVDGPLMRLLATGLEPAQPLRETLLIALDEGAGARRRAAGLAAVRVAQAPDIMSSPLGSLLVSALTPITSTGAVVTPVHTSMRLQEGGRLA
jgi:uroporphyrinogen-III synthase